MTGRLTQRSVWSTFGIVMFGIVLLSLMAACGSDGDDDDDAGNGSTTTVTTASGSGGTTGTATEADTDDGTATSDDMGDMGGVIEIGACLQENTTGDIVTDLRDGNTESAEGMYRACLEDSLPESMVSQLEPIIEQAGTCGEEAAADLSDEDLAAIEEGDEATIEQVTTATLECLSADIGMDLQ